eukprot:9415677-Alexandrium_andersonii.AAC.1
MSASLVGSEMCIRDRPAPVGSAGGSVGAKEPSGGRPGASASFSRIDKCWTTSMNLSLIHI